MSDSLKNKIKYFLIAALILGGSALAYVFQSGQSSNKFETYTVKSVPLGKTVEATGSLEPATSIDLSFQKSGEVSRVLVNVGQRVKKGDLLASLVNTNETSSLAQNKALLAEARASLNLRLANATDADIAIARADVQQALANKQKSDVDYSNSIIDLNNIKKIVEQDIKTAELELESARLNLQKTQSTTSTSTSQNSSSVENSSSALKSSIDQLLVSTKNVLQVLDRMYGIKDTTYLSFKNTLSDGGSFDFMYAKDQSSKL